MDYANLHMHTYFSDGRTSPEELVRHIYDEKGLETFALTDHDTLSGVEPAYRTKKQTEYESGCDSKRFIPGIELSLHSKEIERSVHMIGLFPMINENNYKIELKRIDHVLGPFCRYRSEHRALKDLDGRIYRAFDLNLDGIRGLFDGPETMIKILRDKAEKKIRTRFLESGKTNDIIRYPIPITYQVIIEHWEELIPTSTREKISLYVLRPDRSKTERLACIYKGEGLKEPDAISLAKRNQGSLVIVKNSPLKEMGIHKGLNLLKAAQAVTFLAHPAADHGKLTYEAYDRNVLYPLVENGLDGIEVYYPYDLSHRRESIERYRNIARQHKLLTSGGTDFHGDGRTGLSDIKLDQSAAERIVSFR
ncbi:MAG TPA: PHP domain-containing protein [Deltaproteobacteria bacterium]|nr:PHP domain-containing protein [Deltaproteobacteria bacterium]